MIQVPRTHCSLPNERTFDRLYLSLGTVTLTLCGFYFVQYLSLTGTVVSIIEIPTYSPLWLQISKSTNRISMRLLIFYDSHPKQMPRISSHDYLLRFGDHKLKQEYVPKWSTWKLWHKNKTDNTKTCKILTTISHLFAPKMRSITDTVSFTDSMVYSESIGWPVVTLSLGFDNAHAALSHYSLWVPFTSPSLTVAGDQRVLCYHLFI